jgi:hypothetical protein
MGVGVVSLVISESESEKLTLKKTKNDFFFYEKKIVKPAAGVGGGTLLLHQMCLLNRNLFLSGSKTPALLSVLVFC